MEKSTIIDALKERLDSLEKWRKGRDKTSKAKEDERDKTSKAKEDEDVCPVCGSDLLFVEQGITYCEKCKQYYEETKE